jgi:anti-sigma factor RsiW
MPRKSQAASAEECCAKCERDVAALRKEVAALKAALAKRPSGGADPRVDALVALIKVINPAAAEKYKLA